MFSKTCTYAIRALLFIARHTEADNKLGVKEIAKGIDAPEYFIAKILQELGRKGLVSSLKGPSGGFYLDKKTSKCTLADVVQAIDGSSIFTGCALGLQQCSEQYPCPLHDEFKKIRKEIHETLKSTRLGEFNEQLMKRFTYLKNR
jgi:Rrf2 family protein